VLGIHLRQPDAAGQSRQEKAISTKSADKTAREAETLRAFFFGGLIMDPFQAFKKNQREAWAHFAPLEIMTVGPAARLLKHARVESGQSLLDVGCGTGVVAVTAARGGLRVTGLDLTPELLQRAREHSALAGVEVEWREGDAEQLPFADGAFDAVVSQFAHIFAPRAEVALKEMLRVLKPGGTIAFSTWPPELYVGRVFAIMARYLPAPPPGISPPPQWGDPNIVRERFGTAVKDITFERDVMTAPALSPRHYQALMERTAGPMIKLVETLTASDPARLAQLRSECETLIQQYFDMNAVRQGYLLTRAVKL
jgi:SAM-dependent methyltransferase